MAAEDAKEATLGGAVRGWSSDAPLRRDANGSVGTSPYRVGAWAVTGGGVAPHPSVATVGRGFCGAVRGWVDY